MESTVLQKLTILIFLFRATSCIQLDCLSKTPILIIKYHSLAYSFFQNLCIPKNNKKGFLTIVFLWVNWSKKLLFIWTIFYPAHHLRYDVKEPSRLFSSVHHDFFFLQVKLITIYKYNYAFLHLLLLIAKIYSNLSPRKEYIQSL